MSSSPVALNLVTSTETQCCPRSNTPGLVEDNASDSGDDSDTQYIYIFDDSPFYSPPSSQSASSHLSFNNFSFACDPLLQEDPLFAKAPGAFFEDEFDFASGHDDWITVADDASGAVDPWQNLEWSSTKVDGSISLLQVKSAPMVLQTGSNWKEYSDHPL